MSGRGMDLQEGILEACRKQPKGISSAQLYDVLPLVPKETIMKVVNEMLTLNRLDVFRPKPGIAFFKEYPAGEALKVKNLKAEELLVFQHIKASDNMGMWTKDLKSRTNLQQTQLTKVLRELEKRQLVKAVKSVASGASNRKVYMAYGVEPAREITGGAWYTEHEFDEALIQTLRDTCLKYIEKEHELGLQEIANLIRNAGFLQVDLSDDEIGMIVDTLVYDTLVDRVPQEGGADRFRRSLHDTPATAAFTDIPCGVCPVFSECTPGGVISPASCQYFDSWLEF